MLGTIRYKFVKNKTGLPLTVENFKDINDGNDKQFKIVNRLIGAGDIGVDPGQTGHPDGAILDFIPSGNVLFAEVSVFRPLLKTPGGMTPYNNMDNQVYDELDLDNKILSFEIQFGLMPSDNTIRIIDKKYGTFFELNEDDTVFSKIYFGESEDQLDSMVL